MNAQPNTATTISMDLVRRIGDDVRAILADHGVYPLPKEGDLLWAMDCAGLWFPKQRTTTAGRLALVHAPSQAHEVQRALVQYGATLFETVTGEAL